MGTKIHSKSYLPVFNSMRDLNEDSSSSSWPVFYGDKTVPNGQYCNGFVPRGLVDGYAGHDKDVLKQKMLEHEAVFKNQVCELHRLYRIQRDMMEEAKRKEPHKSRASMEPASSSSHHGSQYPSEEARKWHMAGFPLLNSSYNRPSISGVEIVNSPLSCVKANTSLPFQNGSTSKDSEGLRPLKVRKKLFDLQLPAEEYIDIQEGNNVQKHIESDISGYAPNCNPKSGPESSSKLFFGGHGLRGSNGLADLNEPIQIEEDFIGRAENVESKGVDQRYYPNAGYLGVNGESTQVHDRFLMNSSLESKVYVKGQLAYRCEAGTSRGNLSFATQYPQTDKLPLPSHPVQSMLNPVHNHPSGMYQSGYVREDMWRDGLRNALESSDRNRVHSSNSHLEPIAIASHTPGSYPVVNNNSSYIATSWAHSVSSNWVKPTSSFAQKSTSNGFYHASASGSKEAQNHLPLVGFDNLASDHSTNNGFGIYRKPAIDINLNEILSTSPQDINGKNQPEDHLSALPWLKPKPVKDLKFTLSSSNPAMTRKEEVFEDRTINKILGIPIFERRVQENELSPLASTSASIVCHPEEKNVFKEIRNGLININVACEPDEQMDLEQPIIENEKQEKVEATIRDHIIDLNSCVSDCEDPPPPLCHERKTASVKITLEIDLEVPIFLESEDDNSTLSKENIQDEVPSQSIQIINEQIKDEEVLKSAAEAIVAISSWGPQINTDDNNIISRSSDEASLAEALIWFADSISSHANEEMDDFEAMTLQLVETKEEDYMPQPFVPEISRAEEEENGSNALRTRSRRGQARRGRQRKDFQRDILPGMTTLSRHEVTEDLQTFGGLMRATGHSWNTGSTRRNGTRSGTRGRKRAVVVENVPSPAICTPLMDQLNNHMEGGLEDRSLTGWGKTTRRPRRQRCPAGNIPTIAMS